MIEPKSYLDMNVKTIIIILQKQISTFIACLSNIGLDITYNKTFCYYAVMLNTGYTQLKIRSNSFSVSNQFGNGKHNKLLNAHKISTYGWP